MSFLDVTKPVKTAPSWLHELHKRLLEDVGKPCEAYRDSCFSCRVWAGYDAIREVFEDAG